ncbi:MAG TPA: glutathione synthase [Acidiferrobacterales bacterium]
MTPKLGVVMDPIGSIQLKKDSSYAMLLEAQARGWPVFYMEQGDLYLRDGVARARTRRLNLYPGQDPWFTLSDEADLALDSLDVVLMRKDPPFNQEYIYSTYILELAERRGPLVVNKPQALRDANEKLFTAWFPQCAPPTLVTRDAARLRGFLNEQRDIILKPLDQMGGAMIFRLRLGDPNVSVAIETLTALGTRLAVAQRFVPEIAAGDKRIILVDGEPVPFALARIPAEGETRGNLAAGARGEGRPLTDRDRWICAEVGPELKRRGVLFAGLDVIGDWLTEINITSPTGIRELDAAFGINISALLLDAVSARLAARG